MSAARGAGQAVSQVLCTVVQARDLCHICVSTRRSWPLQEKPPSIEEMLSWNTLTPHYAEDVIYALNAASVAKHFGMDPASAAVRWKPSYGAFLAC